jgi:hypothetical protein
MATRSTKTRSTQAKTRVVPETAAADEELDCGEDEKRLAAIAEAAYYRAETRGFAPGGEMDDWLAAERQFDADRGADD